MEPHLILVVAANAILRIAGGASGVLVGIYIADLARRGSAYDAAIVGVLGAASFAAELVGAIPMGIVADVVPPRALMAGGASLAAAAMLLFGLTRSASVFIVCRMLEGLAAAATVPSLLAYIVDATADDARLRARTMSYFELSLLAGLALGGLLGGELWRALGHGAFAALAVVYVTVAMLLFAGATVATRVRAHAALDGLARAIREPALRRLAPIWLAMNMIVGMWLGPTFYFLLTSAPRPGQLLAGLLATRPDRLGWVLFAYSLVFATGLVIWSVVLPRTRPVVALRVSLAAMLAVSVGLLLLNHAAGAPLALRWTMTAVLAALVMVESGFTPAALSLLAEAVGPRAGRGAAMGIYSFLLGVGALGGNLVAGALGQRFAIDGLIGSTIVMAVVAAGLLRGLETRERSIGHESTKTRN